jgi:hypothetical protein
MPAVTFPRGYPYPLDGDPINVAGDIQKLANAIDNDVETLDNGKLTQAQADARYVNLTGDTMVGQLSATNIVASNANGVSNFNGHILCGMNTVGSNLAPGVEIRNTGWIGSYNYTESQANMWLDHIGDASADQNGFILFRINQVTAFIGSIRQVGLTGVAFNTTSDYRMKTVVGPIDDALTRMAALNPVKVDYNDDPFRVGVDALIAHEVNAQVPDAVQGVKDAVDGEGNPIYQQLDYSKLVPLLVASVQQLLTRIEALEAV